MVSIAGINGIFWEATWILDDVNNWWQMLCMNSLKHLEMLGSCFVWKDCFCRDIWDPGNSSFYQISMKFVGFWLWKIEKATCWVYISRFLCVSKLMSISERSKSGAFSRVSQQKPEDLPEKSTLSRSKRGCWDRRWPYLLDLGMSQKVAMFPTGRHYCLY